MCWRYESCQGKLAFNSIQGWRYSFSILQKKKLNSWHGDMNYVARVFLGLINLIWCTRAFTFVFLWIMLIFFLLHWGVGLKIKFQDWTNYVFPAGYCFEKKSKAKLGGEDVHMNTAANGAATDHHCNRPYH